MKTRYQTTSLKIMFQQNIISEELWLLAMVLLFIIALFLSLGFNSRDHTRTKAMQFLHQMNYNYTTTKFFILFPYYLSYNNFKCHQPLQLSNEEMQKKIKDHMDSLKNTKQKDLERWIGTVQTSIQSKIHLSKLNTFIEVAKQNKYQIPQGIRQHIQRSVRTGRQLKKTLHSTKLSIDKLISKRDTLQDFKIITNQMIQFQETVNRCEQWLKKQKKFEQTYYNVVDGNYCLKNLTQKIDFRTIQLLFNEFNNLPLIYEPFQKTIGILYANIITLLDKLPSFNKSAKTRTAQNSLINNTKIALYVVRQFQTQIQKCPIQHEQFQNFEINLNDSLQWIERIGMFLEDQKSEKTFKLLNQYSKIINDNPIQNKIQAKLQSRLEYYEIMQKVKKDISNPSKYEQIKQAIKKLKEKGYQTCEYAKLQSRIVSYMGWYESQQILNQQRVPPTNIDLVLKQVNIKSRMISQQNFRLQLVSARTQLNIPQQIYAQSQQKVVQLEEHKQQINLLLNLNQPVLGDLVQMVKSCIRSGLIFAQFQLLYHKLIDIFYIIVKMEFLLISNGQILPDNQKYVFQQKQVQIMLTRLIEQKGLDLKDIDTKQTGDQILINIQSSTFPKEIIQCTMFIQFMRKAQLWSNKALYIIANFKTDNHHHNLKDLFQQAKNCLISKAIEEQLNRIDIILKWRQKISRKINDQKQNPFNHEDEQFISQLERELQDIQLIVETQDKMKQKAIEYMWMNSHKINSILGKIANIQIQNTYKLSQMNKFCKQIDREIEKYKLQDKIISDLKQQLQNELLLSDDWKQKYLAIKRFQKKKLNRKEVDDTIKQIQIQIQFKQDDMHNKQNSDGINLTPYQPIILRTDVFNTESLKKKYIIRNGQFCWYFKLVLMIFEFYNGYKLKFSIQELLRLKGTLTDIYKFISHYNAIMTKQDKTDQQLINLQSQGSKFPLFFRQTYILNKKNAYIASWKQIADSIIKSVPVVNMELKARKPEQLLELLQLNKHQQNDDNQKIHLQDKYEEMGNTKRKRRQNPFYSNQDMTLITEDTFGLKTKKKRKGGLNMDTEYRNTAVLSNAKKMAKNQKQDFQRAEAIINGQIPTELIHIDDPKQYCICRYGVPNENSIMIQCEYKCQQWFHIECLGIKKHQTKNDIKFKCVGCRALYKEDSVGYFIWDSYAKVTQYAFVEIVQEGRNLGIQTVEMKKIDIIYSKMVIWKRSVNDLLRRICENNGQDLIALQPLLYELYIHSLWLPTAHPETAILRKLLLLAKNEL